MIEHEDPAARKQYPRVALTLTLAMFAFLVVMALRPVDHHRPPLVIYEYLHVIAFAGLILPAAVLLPKALVRLLSVFAALGALIELVQPLFGRAAEWHDLWANLTGLAIGVGVGLVLRRILVPVA